MRRLILAVAVVLVMGFSPGCDPDNTCANATPTLTGTEDPETLDGTDGADVILGLGGSDIIIGRGGADILCGGPGHDVLFAGFSGTPDEFPGTNDLLDGGEGDDELLGDGGDDRLFGAAGHDPWLVEAETTDSSAPRGRHPAAIRHWVVKATIASFSTMGLATTPSMAMPVSTSAPLTQAIRSAIARLRRRRRHSIP